MVVYGKLVLTAGAQRLSNVYGGASLGNVINAAQDLPAMQILLQATGAAAFLGSDQNVTSTNYGTQILTTALTAERIGPFPAGSVKLSDIWVAGAGATLWVTVITF